MVRIVLVVSALVLALIASEATLAADTLAQVQQTGKLRIGYRTAEPPMSFAGKDGQPEGYTIDICARIATAIKTEIDKPNMAVEFVPVTAETCFTALVDNQIDILCGSTTKTHGRGKLVDFTQLTFVTGASILALRTSGITAMADLRGKKVAVVEGTTTIDAVRQVLKSTLTEAEVVPVASAADGMQAVRERTVDAFSSDQVVLIGLVLTAPDMEQFVISREMFSFEPFALAVRRNDADFRLIADRVVSHLYRTRQIDQIYDRWFGAFAEEKPALLEALYRLNATPE